MASVIPWVIFSVVWYLIIGFISSLWFVYLGQRTPYYGSKTSHWVDDRRDAISTLVIGMLFWPLVLPIVASYQAFKKYLMGSIDWVMRFTAPKPKESE